jgi:ABC-type uncharacterized transport system permease subunit
MASLGKTLILAGILITLGGLGIWFAASMGTQVPGLGRLGRLPGDIYLKRGNFTFYFPLMTSIVVSIALTIIFALLRR